MPNNNNDDNNPALDASIDAIDYARVLQYEEERQRIEDAILQATSTSEDQVVVTQNTNPTGLVSYQSLLRSGLIAPVQPQEPVPSTLQGTMPNPRYSGLISNVADNVYGSTASSVNLWSTTTLNTISIPTPSPTPSGQSFVTATIDERGEMVFTSRAIQEVSLASRSLMYDTDNNEEDENIDSDEVDVIPEPVSGSSFLRRGLAECISHISIEDTCYTVGKVYRISEVLDSGLVIEDDNGCEYTIQESYFRAVDYGPFFVEDTVTILNVDGIILDSGQRLPNQYTGYKCNVLSVESERLQVSIDGIRAWVTTRQVRLAQRKFRYPPNPFKVGDKVKAIRSSHRVYMGHLYEITRIRGNEVQLSNGSNLYHTYLTLYNTKSKKKKVKPVSLETKVRDYVNQFSYKKHLITVPLILSSIKDDSVKAESVEQILLKMYSL